MGRALEKIDTFRVVSRIRPYPSGKVVLWCIVWALFLWAATDFVSRNNDGYPGDEISVEEDEADLKEIGRARFGSLGRSRHGESGHRSDLQRDGGASRILAFR